MNVKRYCMKRFSLIYGLSFILYAGFIFVLLIEDAITYAVEILLLIFGVLLAVSFAYQMIYIVKIGRKENVSVGKGIAQFFMYLLVGFSLGIIAYYIDAFLNGVSTYIFGGNVVYRMEAIEFLNRRFFYCPIVITAIYAVAYFIIVINKRKRTV